MTLSTQPSAANGKAATVVVPGAITVESDGVCSSTCKVLVGGTVVTSLSINNGDSFGCGLTRYSSNGNIDATFGQAGAASASFTPTEPDATLFALALQSNGDIVAAGTAGQPGANPAFVTQADFAFALHQQLHSGFLVWFCRQRDYFLRVQRGLDLCVGHSEGRQYRGGREQPQ